MQDSGEAPHLGIGVELLLLLEPVIHHPRLPRVVDRVGGGDGGVEEALPLLGLGGHFDDGVNREGGSGNRFAREVLLEGSICRNDDVVGDERCREADHHREENIPPPHFLLFRASVGQLRMRWF